MSVDNFIPEFWSRNLNIALRKSLVGLNLVNEDWEGEIQEAGDTVRITRPSGIAVGDYDGSDITVDTAESSQDTLVIDQSKYFAFDVDDVDAVQANVDLIDTYMEEAQYALQDEVDQFIFEHYTDADSDNVIAKEALTAGNIYGKLVEAKKLLSLQNVPKQGRWAVLSPEEVALLEQAEEFQRASDLGDEVSRMGFTGRAAGFDIFESNNVVEANDGTDDVRHLPFGHRVAITFALQFTDVEAMRRELRFADLVKGLMLFGAETIKPEALGVIENNIS